MWLSVYLFHETFPCTWSPTFTDIFTEKPPEKFTNSVIILQIVLQYHCEWGDTTQAAEAWDLYFSDKQPSDDIFKVIPFLLIPMQPLSQ